MDEQDIVATGGMDTNAVLFDRSSGEILCRLTGHSKKVLLHVLWTPSIVFCMLQVYYDTRKLSITQITSLKFVNENGLFITGSADKVSMIITGLFMIFRKSHEYYVISISSGLNLD